MIKIVVDAMGGDLGLNDTIDAILKITGKTASGVKKKILQTIKQFKNNQYPNIAVTVDLLTTGIDVPKICNLVFMRKINSRILFEQMLGCISKTFVVTSGI